MIRKVQLDSEESIETPTSQERDSARDYSVKAAVYHDSFVSFFRLLTI